MSTMNEPTFACSDAWKQWWKEPTLRAKILDTSEKIAIVLLFSSFVVAMWSSMLTSLHQGRSVFLGDLMLLVTESIMVVMVLIRRNANNLSMRPMDWGLAFSATCMSLLARPHDGPGHVWDSIAVLLTMTGLGTQLYAKLTLGRRFGIVAANRGICVAGPYRFVRHPIYCGYVMLHAGFFLLNPTLWNFAVFAILYSLKIPRILAEERLLGQDADYKSYMNRVRFRLIPGLF
jgi:protein-S-isoprenylcysteine O-methyltransferase Ste14